MTLSAGVTLDYRAEQLGPRWQKIGNSLQDKQWTPTGNRPMVPEEEEEEAYTGSEIGKHIKPNSLPFVPNVSTTSM